jgi:hypothetical protein
MLVAEPAKLLHFKPIRIVLFVFHGIVVALFALCAGKGNFDAHNGTPENRIFLASLKSRKPKQNTAQIACLYKRNCRILRRFCIKARPSGFFRARVPPRRKPKAKKAHKKKTLLR